MDRNDVLSEQFSMAQVVEDGVVRLRLFGELDLAAVPHLESELEGATQQAIALDLGGLTFIDVPGLRTVKSAACHPREQRQPLTLIDGSRQVRRLFELTGNEDLLDGRGAEGRRP